jgi:hypothetical protein
VLTSHAVRVLQTRSLVVVNSADMNSEAVQIEMDAQARSDVLVGATD